MIKLEDYVFNIEKVFQIQSDADKHFIHRLYHDLLDEYRCHNVFSDYCKSIFNTLYYSGFLFNKIQFDREKKLDSLDV